MLLDNGEQMTDSYSSDFFLLHSKFSMYQK